MWYTFTTRIVIKTGASLICPSKHSNIAPEKQCCNILGLITQTHGFTIKGLITSTIWVLNVKATSIETSLLCVNKLTSTEIFRYIQEITKRVL